MAKEYAKALYNSASWVKTRKVVYDVSTKNVDEEHQKMVRMGLKEDNPNEYIKEQEVAYCFILEEVVDFSEVTIDGRLMTHVRFYDGREASMLCSFADMFHAVIGRFDEVPESEYFEAWIVE